MVDLKCLVLALLVPLACGNTEESNAVVAVPQEKTIAVPQQTEQTTKAVAPKERAVPVKKDGGLPPDPKAVAQAKKARQKAARAAVKNARAVKRSRKRCRNRAAVVDAWSKMEGFNAKEFPGVKAAAEGLLPCLEHLAGMTSARKAFVDEFRENKDAFRAQMGFNLVFETRGDYAETVKAVSNLECSQKFINLLEKSIGENLRKVQFERLECSPTVFLKL